MRFLPALMLVGISGLAAKSSLALADNSVCNIQFSQSVSISGNSLTARFTPASGSVAPTFVDLHVSKNCPGNPSASSGVCATPFFQPPFDQPYAFNIHSSSSAAAYSSVGTSFDGHSFNFVLDITKLALSSSDQLCYDFTYAFGTTGCDTGICTLAPPTTSPFILPTTCDALTYTQDVAINGNRILAHFIPDTGKPIPTWVDLHVSKNCPGNPAKSNSTCSTPFFQQPFDQPYALNLHAASDPTQFSTPGASFSNGVFTWDFDASILTSVLGGNDVFCYDFTWGFGNLGCDGGVCSLVSPSTSPIIVPPSQQPSCAAASYNQSVSISGNTVLAVFTPTPGSRIPTFVDFHISKNCPNNPSTSTGQCSSPWVQSPFDQPYSFNLHDSAIGTYSSSGATYNSVTNAFTFIFDASKLTSTLSATDKLCYDFTFVFGEFGCDTGICAVSSGTA